MKPEQEKIMWQHEPRIQMQVNLVNAAKSPVNLSQAVARADLMTIPARKAASMSRLLMTAIQEKVSKIEAEKRFMARAITVSGCALRRRSKSQAIESKS